MIRIIEICLSISTCKIFYILISPFVSSYVNRLYRSLVS
nr:MAG TPA: hypothetical protein [Bacteriophage sp.]